jgi:SAM-dependent methyltransferase
MADAERHVEANRVLWNRWTQRDTASDHHKDMAAFREGGLSLRPIERRELGDVSGKSLLHLQCNMGSDTLSWARLGARVTGVDFAETAVAQGQALAAEAGLDARFVCSDLYTLPETLDEQFDIVYTSYGAICWMPDLERWAQVAAHFVKPGGVFYMVDMHPVAGLITEDASGLRVRVPNRYEHSAEPYAEESDATTEDGEHEVVYSWSYSLGEPITALLNAGLRLEYLHEHPMTFWRQYPSLVDGGDGYWHWTTPENSVPLLFSLRATR